MRDPSRQAATATLQTRPRTLYVVWIAWLAIAALTIDILVTAAPLRYAQLARSCAGASCGGAAAYLVALDVFTSLIWLSLALLIFWRRPGDRVGIFASLTLLTFGVARFPDTPLALSAAHPCWWLPVTALRFLGSACLSVFVFVFPNGQFVPRITRWIALVWIALQIPEFFFTASAASSNGWPPWLRFAGFFGFVAAVVAAQAWRYRNVSTTMQRQQTRWVVLGLGLALMCYLAITFGYPLLTAADPSLGNVSPIALTTLTALTFLLLPISLAIAILRHRLYDVDILINRALVYSALTVSLAILYAVTILVLQAVVVAVTNQRQPSPPVIVISTLLVAALFQPLRRSLQHSIDRRFYRRKYDAAATITTFAASLRNEVDLVTLSERLVDAVIETMQPVHAELWLRPPTKRNPEV